MFGIRYNVIDITVSVVFCSHCSYSSSNMHPCLSLPEIVSIIQFYALAENKDTDVISLLRTCRSLYALLLPSIWSDISSLTPLLMCMPEDLWVVEKRVLVWDLSQSILGLIELIARYQEFKREIRQTDWPRFVKHAALVQRVGFQFRWKVLALPSPLAYQVLHVASGGGRTLLPNLQSIDFIVSEKDREHLASFPLLIGPNLKRLSLKGFILLNPEPAYSTLLLSFIHNLPRLCPSLTHIEFGLGLRGTLEAVSTALSGWSHLTSVHAPDGFSSDAFLHLSGLQALSCLHFGGILAANIPSNLHTPAFPCLTNLKMDVSLDVAHPVLKSIGHSSTLTVLSILGSNTHIADVSMWAKLTDTIANVCSSTSLHWLEICDTSKEYMEEVTMTGLKVHGNVIEPLLKFTHLRHLTLSAYYGFDFNDDHIERMAQALPKLQNLEIGNNWSLGQGRPEATFLSLLHLANHCRELNELSMTLDTHDIPNTSNVVKISNNNLHVLDLQYSSISEEDVAPAAYFLSDVFPLSSISNFYERLSSEEDRIVGVYWARVRTFAKVIADARKQELERVASRLTRA
ncbi:hypothetical protein H0H93_012226 [Arthromyces matolae]|nr:hypothetical protein H0H93_012226 [Arthromyces matolae]